MATVKEHYDRHLAHFYSWMTGGFESAAAGFGRFLDEHHIRPCSSGQAIDLGAGHGLQTIPMAERGFKVLAVDFNVQLLSELESRCAGKNVTALCEDIRKIAHFGQQPELIVCCGDTVLHLDNTEEVQALIRDIAACLAPGGKFILSFRDYTKALTGAERIIPVRSDSNRILTCILDYEEESVYVTDLLHVKKAGSWEQSVSSYKKVRIIPETIAGYLTNAGLIIVLKQMHNGIVNIIACK